MDYKGDLSLFLYWIPIILSFGFSLVLFVKRDRTLPQFYLAINFAVVGVSILLSFWYERYGGHYEETLRPIDSVANALGAFPMLFYCISLMKPSLLTRKFIITVLEITLLFVLFVVFTSGFFKGPVPYNMQDVIENISSPSIIWRLFIALCILIVEVYAFIYATQLYLRHRNFIKNNYSYGEDIDLKWLGVMLLLFGCFAFICLLSSVLLNNFIVFLYHAIMMAYVVTVFCMGFRQRNVPIESVEVPADKEAVDFISPDQRSENQMKAKEILTAYFIYQKPYLDPDLSLSHIASALGSNPTYVSNLINRRFNMNFYTFVNNYRIDYAISLIGEDGFNLSVEELYTAAGFKSRSVFYKLFRERTGVSPGNYITKEKTL